MVKPTFSSREISRREFIGTTAVAGAGLMLASSAKVMAQGRAARMTSLTSRSSAAARKVRCGWNPCRSSPASTSWPWWTSGITTARSPSVRFRDAGITVKSYHNYEELLAGEKDLQAVIVATPDFWARAGHERLFEGGPARLLREDDEQHHRGRSLHGGKRCARRANFCRSVISVAVIRVISSR